MDWILGLWRQHCTGEQAFWRRPLFWLVLAALVLPGGSILLALRWAPIRVRARTV